MYTCSRASGQVQQFLPIQISICSQMFANIGFCNPSWISGSELPDPWFWWQGQQFLTLQIQIHMVDARPGTPLVTPGDTMVTYPISESAQQRGGTCYFRLLFGMIRSVEDISLSPRPESGRLRQVDEEGIYCGFASVNQYKPDSTRNFLQIFATETAFCLCPLDVTRAESTSNNAPWNWQIVGERLSQL